MTNHHDPHNAEETVSNVLDNGLIRIGSVVAMVGFLVIASWNVSAWFTFVSTKLEVIEGTLHTLTEDRWRKRDMIRWCRETELKNREIDWACAEIDK